MMGTRLLFRAWLVWMGPTKRARERGRKILEKGCRFDLIKKSRWERR